MIDILEQMLTYLASNYALYLVVTMGIIVSFTIGILSLIKKPIKLLTGKITNEKVRKLANKMFIAFAFGISWGAWFALNLISPQYFPLEEIEVLLTGAFSIVIYALGDGIVTKSQAQQLMDITTEYINDKKTGKTDSNEQSAINEYLKKVK